MDGLPGPYKWHPLGLPIWMLAFYRKSPATEELPTTASPARQQGRVLLPGNLLWTLLFGWWLILVSLVSAGRPRWWRDYATLTSAFWPFGQDVIGDIEIPARGGDADPMPVCVTTLLAVVVRVFDGLGDLLNLVVRRGK